MTKIVKRYCLCAIFLVALVLIIYYNIFGRTTYEIINYQDEFVAVAYVDDGDDGNDIRNRDATEHLVNLTDFRYLIEPSVCNSQQKNVEFLGEIELDGEPSYFIAMTVHFFCSNFTGNIVRWPR